jgi:hypothetical protein
MNAFESSPPGASWEEVTDWGRRVRQYIRNAADPNEAGDDGRTLLLTALAFCSTAEGEQLVTSLLDRGADPNKPTAWAIFTTLITVSNSLPLVKKLLDNGLRINESYEVNCADGELVDGPATILDHLYAVQNRIAPARKRLNALASDHAGGLGKRRRFIAETIALLESHGAKRAAELV